MTEKINEILNKYKSDIWCKNLIEKICDNIQETFKELKDIQYNLSQKILNINLSDELNDDILISDIQNDIKITKELIVYFSEIQKNIYELSETNDTIIFENKIILFVILDNLCPACNVKLCPIGIEYEKISNRKIYKNIINGYSCPCCNRSFILQDEREDDNISFEDTNVTLNFQYLDNSNDDNKQLIFKDVIVLSNLKSCTVKEHNLKDVVAQIPIFNTDGSITFITVNISYCSQCDKYIMLKNDFKNIDGVVACKVIDQTTTRPPNGDDDIEIKQYESVLYKYGYNVKTKDNLSDKQRHLILASVVEAKILTREQICSHLDTLIERGNKIEKWKSATQKWKQDRHFVKKYNIKSLPDVLLNKIILKYSQLSLLDIPDSANR